MAAGKAGNSGATPSRRVYHKRDIFVPTEKKNSDGTWGFQTSDKTKYVRGPDGSIRRKTPKVKKCRRHS